MTKNRKLILGITGIAAAFLVPLSFYLVTVFFSRDKITLPPYYHIERIDRSTAGDKTTADTVYHRVADMQLTNQLGHQVHLNKDLQGKMVLVNFFYSTCPTVCPKLTGNIGLLQQAFRKTAMKDNDTLVQFISITVTPEMDSFPVLRAYADRYQVDHDHWWFLTGDKKTIYNYARNELHLSVGQGDGGADDFIHSEQLVLLDRDRYIRGYYNGLDTAELRRCANDIGWLVLEKKHKK